MHGRRAFALVLFLFSGLVLLGCGLGTDSVGSTVHGSEFVTGALPPNSHRASQVACTTSRAPGNGRPNPSSFLSPNPCTSDSDCRGGLNGRCRMNAFAVGSAGAGIYYECNYDDCSVDEECPSGGVCDCRASGEARNRCFAGDCRVDSDCSETFVCAPSARNANLTGTSGRSGAVRKPDEIAQGYFCHRATDECSIDSDCVTFGAEGQTRCAFRSDSKHWVCTAFDGEN